MSVRTHASGTWSEPARLVRTVHRALCPALALALLAALPAGAQPTFEPGWIAELRTTVSTSWPLCGDIMTDDPTYDEAEGCPASRADDPAFADPMISTYGPRDQGGQHDFHRGLDIRTAAPGAPSRPVFAVADGEVHEVAQSANGGQRVVLRHDLPNGGTIYTLYNHLASATPAQQILDNDIPPAVTRGVFLGMTGVSSSGNPHLHFEVRKGASQLRAAVHPLRLLAYDGSKLHTAVLQVDNTGSMVEPHVRVELDTARFDVVRVSGWASNCPLWDDVCPYPDYPNNQRQGGYSVNPTFIDYEEWNYQYTHKSSSFHVFHTGGVYQCPYHLDHGLCPSDANDTTPGDYCPDYHLDDPFFNSVELGVFPITQGDYRRSFVFHAIPEGGACVWGEVEYANGDRESTGFYCP